VYYIIQKLKKGFEVTGHAQDGAECWECATIEEAIEVLIEFAKVTNGTTITKDNIHFGKEKSVVETIININIDWE